MLKRKLLIEYRYLLAIVILWILFASFYLDRFPLVYMDENWDLNTSYTYINDGVFAARFLKPNIDTGMHYCRVEPRLLHMLLMIPVGMVLGISHITARLLSIFFGLLTIITMYFWLRRHLNEAWSTLGCLLLMVETLFWTVSRSFRPEIESAFILTASLYMLDLILDKDKSLHWFLLGILSGIGGWTHPNYFFLAFAIFIFLLSHFGFSIIKKRGFYLYLSGGLLAFVPYLIFVLYTGPEYFTRQTFRGDRLEHFGSTKIFLKYLMTESIRYEYVIQFPKRIIIFLLEIAGVLFLLKIRKENPIFKAVAFVIIFFVLSLSIFIAMKSPRYLTCFIPLFIFALTMMLERMSRSRYKALSYILCGLFLLNNIAGDIYLLARDRHESYSLVEKKLRPVIPHDAKVLGDITLWLSLKENNYLSTLYVGEEDINAFDPDYLVLVSKSSKQMMESQIVRMKTDDPENQNERFHDFLKDSILKRGGRLIYIADVGHYGPVEVYFIQKK